MSKSKDKSKKTNYPKSLAKGIVAGLVGGVIAAAAKSLVERFYPPMARDERDPAALPAKSLAGNELALPAPSPAAKNIQWAEGAIAGAAYGAVAEFYPAATTRDGAGFGMALASIKQEGALAALGLAAAPVAQNTREHAREITLHVVYGMVTETVRRVIRRLLE